MVMELPINKHVVVYYIIYNTKLGCWLPNPIGRRGRCSTHVSPTMFDPPRLFISERSGKVALSWWLKGVTTVTVSFGKYGVGGEFEDEGDMIWHTKPMSDRILEDWKVLPCSIRVGE